MVVLMSFYFQFNHSLWLDVELVYTIGTVYNFFIYSAIFFNLLFVIYTMIDGVLKRYRKNRFKRAIGKALKRYNETMGELAEKVMITNRHKMMARVYKTMIDKAIKKHRVSIDESYANCKWLHEPLKGGNNVYLGCNDMNIKFETEYDADKLPTKEEIIHELKKCVVTHKDFVFQNACEVLRASNEKDRWKEAHFAFQKMDNLLNDLWDKGELIDYEEDGSSSSESSSSSSEESSNNNP